MALSPEERQRRIETMRQFPAKLEALIVTLSEEQLNTHYIPGEWNVRQNVHHLPDSHSNAFIRLKLILTEDHPTLKPYDQDVWALLPDVERTPVSVSLRWLDALHERWCILWESLTEEQWARAGFHPENGDMSAEDILISYSDHCDAHWEQITRTLAAAPK